MSLAPTVNRIPYHLAIIMDGNGRWAKARGLPRLAGHRAGTENLRRTLKACVRHDIKILTIYAFSTENWGRPAEEVRGLMTILEQVIERELKELHEQGVCIRHVGRTEGISPRLLKKIQKAPVLTVSDAYYFARYGVMVNFYSDAGGDAFAAASGGSAAGANGASQSSLPSFRPRPTTRFAVSATTCFTPPMVARSGEE